jgi:membrane protein YdbS with pleckstrin-like domain
MSGAVQQLVLRILDVDTHAPPLPAGGSPRVFRASPDFLRYRIVAWLFGHLVAGAALTIAVVTSCVDLNAHGHTTIARVIPMLVAVALGVVAVVSYAIVKLDYQLRWYVVTDRSIRIREGAIVQREMTLTLANVQNLRLSQGPLQKLFGIADVVVETAGGTSTVDTGGTAALRGVRDAAALREELHALAEKHRGAGLGDVDDAAHPPATTDVHAALQAVRDETRALRDVVNRRRSERPPPGA